MGTRTSKPPLDRILNEAAWLGRLARALVDSEADATDLTQDVLVAALRRPPTGTVEQVRAWLSTTARRMATRRRERAEAARVAETRAARPERTQAGAEAELLQERLAIQRELLDALQLASPEDQEVLVLRYFDGLPLAEIATRLHVSPAGCRKRLSRARERLRERLSMSERGEHGWLKGLALVAHPVSTRAPRPLAPPSPEPPPVGGFLGWLHVLFSAALMSKIPVAVGVAVSGLVALLLFSRAAPHIGGPDLERSHGDVAEASLAAISAPGAGEPQSTARRSAESGDVLTSAPDAVESVAAWLVRGPAGEVITGLRGGWVNPSMELDVLNFDGDGRALREDSGRGHLYLTAPGYEWNCLPIGAVLPDGVETRITLPAGHLMEFVVRVDGLTPAESLSFVTPNARDVYDFGLPRLGRSLEAAGLVPDQSPPPHRRAREVSHGALHDVPPVHDAVGVRDRPDRPRDSALPTLHRVDRRAFEPCRD